MEETFNNPHTYSYYNEPSSVDLVEDEVYHVFQFDRNGSPERHYNYMARFLRVEEAEEEAEAEEEEEEYKEEWEITRRRDFIFEIVEGINIPIPTANDGIIKVRENSDIAINTNNALTLNILNINREQIGTIMAMNTDTVDQVLTACQLKYPEVYRDRHLAMIYKGERPPGDATLEDLNIENNSTIFIFFKVAIGDGKKKRVTKKKVIKKRITRKVNKKRNTRKVIRHKGKKRKNSNKTRNKKR
jgi:ribosomal protein L21